jgi:hypothetical protein
MDPETIAFLNKVFEHNSEIKINSKPPKELYENVIKNHINNIDIEAKSFIPIEDLLELGNTPEDWMCISAHSDINSDIIKKYFGKIDFAMVTKNENISGKELCQILIDLETSEKIDDNVLNKCWSQIINNSTLNIDDYVKYQKKFNKEPLCLKMLKNIDVDSKKLHEIDIIKIFDNFTFNDVNGKYSYRPSGVYHNIIDIEDYLLDTIIIVLGYSFEHHHLMSSLNSIVKGVHKKKGGATNPNNINNIILKHDACKKKEIYTLLINTYMENYGHDNNFKYQFMKFYEFLLGQYLLLNKTYLGQSIINNFVQNPYISQNDLKYFIDKKVITILPSVTVEYKQHAEFLFSEYDKGNIKGCLPSSQGKYTNKQYIKLVSTFDEHGEHNITYRDIERILQLNVVAKRNTNYNYNNTIVIYHEIAGVKSHYDLHTLHDIYKKLNKLSKNKTYKRFTFEIHNTLFEDFLYQFIFNDFNISTSSRDKFFKYSVNYKLSPLKLEFILQNMNLNPDEASLISLQSNLTPHLINKYGSIFDWHLLKFNRVWLMYPHKDFNKLPVFDEDNFWLWASPQEKIKKIEEMKLRFKFNIVDDNYIELDNNNKCSVARCNDNYDDYYNFHQSRFTYLNINKQCNQKCLLCNPIQAKNSTKNYHYKIYQRGYGNKSNFSETLKLFLPTIHITKILRGSIGITDFSLIND